MENCNIDMSMYDWHNYVKKEFHEEFEAACKKNCLDFYSCGIILTAHMIMMELCNKKSPKEAHDIAFKNVTGHSYASASMALSMAKHFAPRGEEFYAWCKENKVI